MKKEKVEIQKKTYTAQEFIERYRALCEETGWNFAVTPAFVKRDDGTYSIILNMTVERLQEK